MMRGEAAAGLARLGTLRRHASQSHIRTCHPLRSLFVGVAPANCKIRVHRRLHRTDSSPYGSGRSEKTVEKNVELVCLAVLCFHLWSPGVTARHQATSYYYTEDGEPNFVLKVLGNMFSLSSKLSCQFRDKILHLTLIIYFQIYFTLPFSSSRFSKCFMHIFSDPTKCPSSSLHLALPGSCAAAFSHGCRS